LLETFIKLKQHLIRNVVRSMIDDIIRLKEQIEPLNLFSDDVKPFTLGGIGEEVQVNMLGQESTGVPTYNDVMDAFANT
jgi:hypothetical protein